MKRPAHGPVPAARKRGGSPPAKTRAEAGGQRFELATWIVLALPAAVAIATFANTLANDFTYDDAWVMRRFGDMFSQLPLPAYFTSGRGLTYVVHLIDYKLWGDWPAGYHLTNILLHACASALAALLALELTRSKRAGLFCGLLFAVHPVHVEAVASFANRKEILAFILVSLSMFAWCRSEHRSRNRWIALVLFALALLAKEVAAIALPVVLLVYMLLLEPRTAHSTPRVTWRVLIRLLPAGILVVGALLWFMPRLYDYESIRHQIEVQSNGQITSYPDILRTSLNSTPMLLRLLVFPTTLAAEYPFPVSAHFGSGRTLFSVALCAIALSIPIVLRRRAPVAAFGALWTLIFYLPLSNLLPLTPFFVQDRYLYVPSFGLCLMFGVALDWAVQSLANDHSHSRRRQVYAIGWIALILATTRSLVRNSDWKDTKTLWESALAAGVETAKAHSSLGIMNARGRQPLLAIDHYRRALQLRPSIDDELSLAKQLVIVGHVAQAEQLVRSVLQRVPAHAAAAELLTRIQAFDPSRL